MLIAELNNAYLVVGEGLEGAVDELAQLLGFEAILGVFSDEQGYKALVETDALGRDSGGIVRDLIVDRHRKSGSRERLPEKVVAGLGFEPRTFGL